MLIHQAARAHWSKVSQRHILSLHTALMNVLGEATTSKQIHLQPTWHIGSNRLLVLHTNAVPVSVVNEQVAVTGKQASCMQLAVTGNVSMRKA